MAIRVLSVSIFVYVAQLASAGSRYAVIRSEKKHKQPVEKEPEPEEGTESEEGTKYRERPMSVIGLNRFIFDANVVQCLGQHTDHWIVIFCPSWYPPCQKVLPTFRNTSEIWQEKLNSDVILRSRARFAEVDCATDKELCNEQQVADYPTIVHYNGGSRVSKWTGDSDKDFTVGLSRWVRKELSAAKTDADRHPLFHVGGAQQAPPEEVPTAAAFVIFAVCVAVPIYIVLSGSGMIGASTDKQPPRAVDEPAKPEQTAASAEPKEELPRVLRCVPAEWAQRGSLEL